MNRRNNSRAVAAYWAEVRAAEEKARAEARTAAVAHREQSIRTGEWAPQVPGDWREPAYQPRHDIPIGMNLEIRRGQRREKKIHNVAVSD